MNTMTYGAALDLIGVSVPEHLIADSAVPVLTGPQAQGDVGIIPATYVDVDVDAASVRVGPEGIQIVTGEATGNTHWLHAEGDVRWARVEGDPDDPPIIGLLTVADGATAWIIHTDEHGANGVGPGTYAVTGKREQADIVRRVAD